MWFLGMKEREREIDQAGMLSNLKKKGIWLDKELIGLVGGFG